MRGLCAVGIPRRNSNIQTTCAYAVIRVGLEFTLSRVFAPHAGLRNIV